MKFKKTNPILVLANFFLVKFFAILACFILLDLRRRRGHGKCTLRINENSWSGQLTTIGCPVICKRFELELN